MQNGANTLRSLNLFVSSHFMFNVLSKLQSEILSGEKRKAISTLSLYSKLFRQACRISEMQKISLEEEELFLNTYCLAEQERFSDSPFLYSIKGFETSPILIEPFLIQPFVELAILGGIGITNHEVKIEFETNEKTILIHSGLLHREIRAKIEDKIQVALQRLEFFKHTYENIETNELCLQRIILG